MSESFIRYPPRPKVVEYIENEAAAQEILRIDIDGYVQVMYRDTFQRYPDEQQRRQITKHAEETKHVLRQSRIKALEYLFEMREMQLQHATDQQVQTKQVDEGADWNDQPSEAEQQLADKELSDKYNLDRIKPSGYFKDRIKHIMDQQLQVDGIFSTAIADQRHLKVVVAKMKQEYQRDKAAIVHACAALRQERARVVAACKWHTDANQRLRKERCQHFPYDDITDVPTGFKR